VKVDCAPAKISIAKRTMRMLWKVFIGRNYYSLINIPIPFVLILRCKNKLLPNFGKQVKQTKSTITGTLIPL
jgi:hypothetical protein